MNVFRKAESCLKTRSFLTANNIDFIEENSESVNWKELSNCAKKHAKSLDRDEFIQSVQDILLSMGNQPWELFCDVFVQLAIEINQIRGNKDSADIFAKKVFQKIESMENSEELKNWFVDLYDNNINWMNNEKYPSAVPMMERVVDYINDHYDENNLNLNELAEKMHISAAYLGKLFRSFTGVGFNEYLTKVRMEHARDLLLLQRDKNIASIANEVGYLNIPYFTATFKKYYGISPSVYRSSQE